MREIKFRIWDGNNKRYVYPEIIELNRGLEYEQFTGLKDKNGKEIYEGDIIRCIYPDNNLIIYDSEMAMFSFSYETKFGSSFIALYRHLSDVEVIGNIHENPELLKET